DGVTDDVDGEGADDEAVTGTDGGEEANLFGEAATPEEFLALQPGDCTNAVATDDRFAITPPVACDGPHLFEVLSLLEAPEAGGEFPGENALLTGAIVVCTENFERRFGVDQSLTSLSVLTFSPSEEEWNDGLYRQICTVYRSDLQPLLVPIGDDVEQWQWQTGDSISVIELQDGFCFDTPVELAADFAQRVVFVDCTEPHDAEKYGTVLLDDLVTGDDGGLVYPGPEQLARTAFPLCHDRLHELYGADHNDVGITSRAILPSEQDYARTDNPLAVCIVEFDPPADRPLDEVAVS
ncbi:MAG: septum formation family protein, partial [Actinomycetota bacterium]